MEKIRDPYILTVKIPKLHVQKLDDIAAHDGVSRSRLVREAIAKKLAGRKATLYGHRDAFGQTLPVPNDTGE